MDNVINSDWNVMQKILFYLDMKQHLKAIDLLIDTTGIAYATANTHLGMVIESLS